MSKPNDKVKNLIAAIQRKTPQAPASAPVAEAVAEPMVERSPNENARQSKRASKPKESRAGKAVQFWMYDDERRLVRELSAWIAGQGVRPSDSIVIRAALRLAKVGGGFLEAYREAAKLDGRIKHN